MSAIDYDIRQQSPLGLDEDEAPRTIDIDHVRPLPRISVHAFCETEATLSVLERCGQDRRMAKVNFRINSGNVSAAAQMFSTAPTPDMIILEASSSPENLLRDLMPLAESRDPSTKVIVVGRHNDITLYRDLLKNGISEYLVAPVKMADILNTLCAIFVDPNAEPLGRSIAFIGVKGGVGSSTIAHNCAFGISNLFSTETILADLDLPFGTANIDFDQDPAQGIAEAVAAPDRLDEVFLDRLLTKCSEHLSLLAAPSILDRPFDFDRTAFHPVVEVLQRSAPMTVLDLPHGWTDWTRSILAEADEVVMTAVPDLANLRNAKNMIDALRKLRPNDKPPHLILNQVNMPKRQEILPAEFCEPLELEAMAILPFDIQLFGTAANSGRMIAELDAKSPSAETFSQIVHVLTGRASAKKSKRKGLGSMLKLLKRK